MNYYHILKCHPKFPSPSLTNSIPAKSPALAESRTLFSFSRAWKDNGSHGLHLYMRGLQAL